MFSMEKVINLLGFTKEVNRVLKMNGNVACD